jgi:hypothetical protein
LSDDTPVIGKNRSLFNWNNGGAFIDFWQTDQSKDNDKRSTVFGGSQFLDPFGFAQGGENIVSGGSDALGDLSPSVKHQKPGAPPTEADAWTTASRDALNRQNNIRSASTTLTGGQGLLDEPQTASRVLLGN